MNSPGHIPVLLREAIAALSPQDGSVHVDMTYGDGGYTRALLESAAVRVFAIDRDPDAIARAHKLAPQFPGRLRAVLARFGDAVTVLHNEGVGHVAGVVMDLGVSSQQLDHAERGFSFQKDGPLDMRMGTDGPSAAELVNTLSEVDLADTLFQLGEERHARRIARAVVEMRGRRRIERTRDLAEIVAHAAPAERRREGAPIHPATRTFQALRMLVNDELGELERGLEAAEELLAPEGRLAVVAFHSLEDRMVKQFLTERSGNVPNPSRHVPLPTSRRNPTFRLPQRGAQKPTPAEVAANPRARSARLRAAVRTDAPAWARAA
ncbi:MAG: 16S rRNA (cytosine(1402)-N(4))-methyltransferase RsmH [Alphaproteobacteria bacterium]|nr:16S rRNA (cytosine(1402)-N(4))-methyltransferase RsmH [Alphaproteobacteria bacterium]